ncbi:hypothetical protein AB0I39_19510 [Kitasatospora purpeofusca]|uniref:hypothetical protein n=1 Tax=Kitasatospora purpeofusca TaxID=67352 RepID=UPI0033C87E0F
MHTRETGTPLRHPASAGVDRPRRNGPAGAAFFVRYADRTQDCCRPAFLREYRECVQQHLTAG